MCSASWLPFCAYANKHLSAWVWRRGNGNSEYKELFPRLFLPKAEGEIMGDSWAGKWDPEQFFFLI